MSWVTGVAVAAGLVLSGCTIPVDDATADPAAAAPSTGVPAPALTGRTVFLDPGHSGANYASIGGQVPTGRGGVKDCQTTGTGTDAGSGTGRADEDAS